MTEKIAEISPQDWETLLQSVPNNQSPISNHLIPVLQKDTFLIAICPFHKGKIVELYLSVIVNPAILQSSALCSLSHSQTPHLSSVLGYRVLVSEITDSDWQLALSKASALLNQFNQVSNINKINDPMTQRPNDSTDIVNCSYPPIGESMGKHSRFTREKHT